MKHWNHKFELGQADTKEEAVELAKELKETNPQNTYRVSKGSVHKHGTWHVAKTADGMTTSANHPEAVFV